MKILPEKIQKNKLNWRIVWYSVLVWLVSILIGSFVILPWFYFALPVGLFWITIIFFRKGDRTLKRGLRVALIWFFVCAIFDTFEVLGPYYLNAELYFSDARNWLKFPLILLIPVIYSLVLETASKKSSIKVPGRLSPQS